MGKIITREFNAKGTTCESCEKIITKQALKIPGVKKIKLDYATGDGEVTFDETKTDIDEILYKIEEKGYECSIIEREEKTQSYSKYLSLFFIIIGAAVAFYFASKLIEGVALPQLSPQIGYGLLFLVGLLTGFHCIAMCGGFVVSYTANDAENGKKSYKSHLIYGASKTLSYTLIGAAFGFIGSIIAFTPMMRGVAGILAGIFLLIFGLGMLNIIPALKKFRLKTPGFLNRFLGKQSEKHSSSPLVIGLLNGLMIACGPLQAIYILAAGTGSAIEGAKMLFIFGLGTLPVMLGFGYFATFVSAKMTHKILKASGVVVIILGLLMINNGLSLTGSGYDVKSLIANAQSTQLGGGTKTYTQVPQSGNIAAQKEGYQEIRMDVTARGWSPDKFILQKGVPVKWVINGKEITSCNNAIQVPKYNLEFPINPGEQTIEFTPTETGVIAWSCWMGMIPGTFVVVDDINSTDAQAQANTATAQNARTGGTCGGSGGGCGCAMMRK